MQRRTDIYAASLMQTPSPLSITAALGNRYLKDIRLCAKSQ